MHAYTEMARFTTKTVVRVLQINHGMCIHFYCKTYDLKEA